MTVKEISEISDLSGGARALVRDDSTPSSYLDSLEKQELFQDAIRFLAHKLPTGAGVKWAAACARELRAPDSKEQKDEPLDAVDQWIKTPGDPTRWAAKEAADKAETTGPSNLAALAVFLSGGSVSPPGGPEIPPPEYAAQKLIAGSVVVAVVSHEPQNAAERYKHALKMGKEMDAPGNV
jgi:hypothetical protein